MLELQRWLIFFQNQYRNQVFEYPKSCQFWAHIHVAYHIWLVSQAKNIWIARKNEYILETWTKPLQNQTSTFIYWSRQEDILTILKYTQTIKIIRQSMNLDNNGYIASNFVQETEAYTKNCLWKTKGSRTERIVGICALLLMKFKDHKVNIDNLLNTWVFIYYFRLLCHRV